MIEHPSGHTSLANQRLGPKNNPKALANQAPGRYSPTSSAQSGTGGRRAIGQSGSRGNKTRWPMGFSWPLPSAGPAMEPPGPALAGEVESLEVEPCPSWPLTPSAAAGARLGIHLSSRALTPACPTQKWPLPWGHLGHRQSLRFPVSPPSFPFHVSANLGGQSCLMDFSPISATQLWWRMAPADQPEAGTEPGPTNRAAEAPIHTNPICSPLCRLLRLCFLESNLNFGSPLWHFTVCRCFFRWKTKNP